MVLRGSHLTRICVHVRAALPGACLIIASCAGEPARAPAPAATSSAVSPPLATAKPVSIPAECTSDAVDVGKVLESAACRDAAGTQADAPDRVSVKLVGPREIKGGARAAFEVVVTNTSSSPVTLRVLPLPWALSAKDAAGKSTTVPMNPHPCGSAAALAALSHGIAEADPHAGGSAAAATFVIAPGGTAHAPVAWEAMGTKWGPQRSTSLAACVADKAPAPLAGGAYTVKVHVPVVGVTLRDPEAPVTVVP